MLYGHPDFGDERVLFNFAPNGSVRLARQDGEDIRPWIPLNGWRVEREAMTFSDFRSGRQFQADLRRQTLGGSWRTQTLVGGWWCTAMDAVPLPAIETEKPAHVMPPLIPEITSTPRYPLQAIRDAKQGRAVTCFFVDAQGLIVQPELVELSDEVFRAPILLALARSRYQGWKDERVLRPGCRSYIFKLDSMN